MAVVDFAPKTIIFFPIKIAFKQMLVQYLCGRLRKKEDENKVTSSSFSEYLERIAKQNL